MKTWARRMLAIHVLVLAFGLWASSMEAQAPSGAAPRQAALALFTTLQKQDWKGLHFVCAFPEKVADALPPSPEAFAAGVRSGIGGGSHQERVDSMFNGMSGWAVGGADLRGDYATLRPPARSRSRARSTHLRAPPT